MDVDGTLTNGKIYTACNGESVKAFDVKDGYGIANLLPLMDISPVIITGRTSKINEFRCNELGITHFYQGIKNKKAMLDELLLHLNLDYSQVAYIGDDLNDLDCLKVVRIAGCPADASDEVKKSVSYICRKKGGYGAVREFIEYISYIGEAKYDQKFYK